MKISFEFPKQIEEFIKNNKIKRSVIKQEIMKYVEGDLLDKNYNPLPLKEIKVAINGIRVWKGKSNKIYISPKAISKKKPLKTVSSSVIKKRYTIYYHYLIFKIS